MFSHGSGAEMRHAMGVAVFSGMIGVTVFGLVLTPVFYWAVRRLAARRVAAPEHERPAAVLPEPVPHGG